MIDVSFSTSHLDLRAYSKKEWVLLDFFSFTSVNGETYTAPKWFVTDLASIPWIAQPVFDDVEHRRAGVIHDWLYCSQVVTKEVADALFFEMVLALGCDIFRAHLMLYALQKFGQPRWDACKGGVKVEDLAFEMMNPGEKEYWISRLAPHPS